MASELAALLYETTLATSAAVLLVLLLRGPVRRGFGAGAAYALWWLVPAALVAVLLPAAAEPVVPPLGDAIAFTANLPRAEAVSAVADRSIDGLAAAWVVGVMTMLLAMAWRQGRFVAGLGPLQRTPDGHLRSVATRGLPAVIGLRPRIVLPGDFEQRYTAPERDLVLAHERVHLRRGDVPVCALAALLRALFWFNPLLHLAASRFRSDQEFACDAAVLRRHPDPRRAYGEALLNAKLAGDPLPFGCHWYGTHPLKERFAMIVRTQPSTRRHLAGLALGTLLALATAATAWATQPAPVAKIPPGKIALDVAFKVDDDEGYARVATLVLAPGEAGREDFEHAGEPWESTWTVTPLADGTFDLAAKLVRDGEVVAEPRMILRDTAAIGVGQDDAEGAFHGIAVEVAVRLGPPAPGMAAVGIRGEVPAYPAAANEAGEGGVVMLELVVGTDGKVVDAQVLADGSTIAADSSIAQNTLAAARKWTLEPATKNGVAVQGTVRVPVRFEPDPVE